MTQTEELTERTVPQGRPRNGLRLRGWVVLLLVMALLAGAVTGGVLWHRAHHVHRKLLSAAAGLGDGDRLVNVPQGSDPSVFVSGSRIVHDSRGALGRARAQQRWLESGTVPGVSVPQFRSMITDALLDIRTLTARTGASVASGPSIWHYVWPRDAAFSAAALSVSGHVDDAETILSWLQRLPAPDGLFQARYLPDGSGPPDQRGVQTDGTGWILWAIDVTVQHATPPQRQVLLDRLGPLISRTKTAALQLTSAPDALPPAAQDYWEVTDPRLSLGTAAPIALGLESAARLERLRGASRSAAQLASRAAAVRASITREFGAAGYPRYRGGQHRDASLVFLLPPFTSDTDPAVLNAWGQARSGMARPGGGLAPGAGWRNDGISWTPETALAALAAAGTGDQAEAVRRLNWLDVHRTELGALPEKVLSDGEAAGPAPLGWTAAIVVLAAYQLDQPVPPAA